MRAVFRSGAAGRGLARLLTWVLVLLLGSLSAATASAAPLSSLKPTALPALPAQPPLLGMVSSGDALLAITAQGGWRMGPGASHWQALERPLPGPVRSVLSAKAGEAYLVMDAATGSTADGLRLVRIDPDAMAPATPLAVLPMALRAPRLARLGVSLVATGLGPDGRPQLWQLESDTATAWQRLPDWPEAVVGQGASALLAQTGALYVTVPAATGATAATAASTEGDRLWRWKAGEGWQARPAAPGPLLPGNARATGQAHLLFLLKPASPGAAPQPVIWHTVTQAWASLPAIEGAPHWAADGAFVPWRNGYVQWRGDANGTLLSAHELDSGKLLLKWADWLVIVVYLVSMLGMGAYFYLREKRQSTAEFFVGGRSIPFWAAGVSLYAANTSSISYIAIPAKAFETNWQYMTNNLVAVLGLMFVAVWIVPLLRRLDLMSVFSYLETRFHPAIRMLSSALCILVQLGSRMSVILFLPSLAIATITGLDVTWSILMMGGFTIVYTALGGMKAVVWTDVVQLVVKMGGAMFAIGYMVWALPGGVGQFIDTAAAAQKTKLFDFSFDLTKATVWGFIFLVVFDVVLTFPKDQVLMQRTLSTKNDKDAGRSIWAFAAIMIPGGIVFYSIGTALYVYYQARPERMNPLLGIDATFPLFIAAELPTGVTGLIIAGIFAAAMATLSSIMNSVSTLASVDFYEKLVKQPDPKRSVLFAELMTVASGLVGIGLALLLSRYDIHSLFDVSIELAGLLGGGFAGAYTLGMFTRRANAPGVAIGVAAAIVLTTIAWAMKLVHPYFYLAISILLCIVIGYAASWLFPPPKQSLKGLTIYKDAE